VAGAAGNGTVTNGALADGTAANGAVADGRSRGRPHAAANSADNGNPTQPNEDLLDVERDGSPRDT
jgi:hypothetical protein